MAEHYVNRDEARAYFKDKGLTYNDIKVLDLAYLKELLDEKFLQQREAQIRIHGRPLYWRRMNAKTEAKWGYTNMICAYLTAKGEYFSSREVISFNRDGFIGFCGDSDDENLQPVVNAFTEWCDWLAAKKDPNK